MSGGELNPYIYAQEITLHIRVGRKFHFMPQLCSALGTEVLREVLASPIPFIFPILNNGPRREMCVYILL